MHRVGQIAPAHTGMKLYVQRRVRRLLLMMMMQRWNRFIQIRLLRVIQLVVAVCFADAIIVVFVVIRRGECVRSGCGHRRRHRCRLLGRLVVVHVQAFRRALELSLWLRLLFCHQVAAAAAARRRTRLWAGLHARSGSSRLLRRGAGCCSASPATDATAMVRVAATAAAAAARAADAVRVVGVVRRMLSLTTTAATCAAAAVAVAVVLSSLMAAASRGLELLLLVQVGGVESGLLRLGGRVGQART